jgi:hypothetical protein
MIGDDMRGHRLTVSVVAAIMLGVVIAVLLVLMLLAPNGTALAG